MLEIEVKQPLLANSISDQSAQRQMDGWIQRHLNAQPNPMMAKVRNWIKCVGVYMALRRHLNVLVSERNVKVVNNLIV